MTQLYVRHTTSQVHIFCESPDDPISREGRPQATMPVRCILWSRRDRPYDTGFRRGGACPHPSSNGLTILFRTRSILFYKKWQTIRSAIFARVLKITANLRCCALPSRGCPRLVGTPNQWCSSQSNLARARGCNC
jgi:hypothetical protein